MQSIGSICDYHRGAIHNTRYNSKPNKLLKYVIKLYVEILLLSPEPKIDLKDPALRFPVSNLKKILVKKTKEYGDSFLEKMTFKMVGYLKESLIWAKQCTAEIDNFEVERLNPPVHQAVLSLEKQREWIQTTQSRFKVLMYNKIGKEFLNGYMILFLESFSLPSTFDMFTEHIETKFNEISFKDILITTILNKLKENESSEEEEGLETEIGDLNQIENIKAIACTLIIDYLEPKLPKWIGIDNQIKSIVSTGVERMCHLLYHEKIIRHWVFTTIDFLIDKIEKQGFEKLKKSTVYVDLCTPFSKISLQEKNKIIKEFIKLSMHNYSWLTVAFAKQVASRMTPAIVHPCEKILSKKQKSYTYEKLIDRMLKILFKHAPVKQVRKIEQRLTNITS